MQLLCDQVKIPQGLLSLLPHTELPESNQEKLEHIFEQNREGVLKLLEEKRETISAFTYWNLVRAVRKVSLGNFTDEKTKGLFHGACSRPNAIYVKSMHKILVCPGLEKFPEYTLHQIMAHELGHVVQKLQKSVDCFKEYSKSQAEEAFADWVASKVVSAKITLMKDRKIAHKSVVESQLLFLSLACQSQNTKPDWARSHPSLQNRVENIFLAQPALQEALDCESKLPKSCG